MTIREVQESDLQDLLTLYTQLHNNSLPPVDPSLERLWAQILADENHHILAGFVDDALISACTLLIVPNLTHGQRPYGLIENVVTHAAHRNRGCASALLQHARERARAQHCYKLMLMTSAKDAETLRFYARAGYDTKDKTAFVQWLDFDPAEGRT